MQQAAWAGHNGDSFATKKVLFYYTFYTRTTQNGEIPVNTYVDLREKTCKTSFEEALATYGLGDL